MSAAVLDGLRSPLPTTSSIQTNHHVSQLRQLLIIPATQDIVLERFSDSAGAYITLDSNNPSVYKQLYRAAKAKLKLRIKVSTVDSTGPNPHTDGSEIPHEDHLSPNCYVPPTIAPGAAKTDFGLCFSPPGGICPAAASSDAPAPPSPPTQVKADNAGRLLAARLRQEFGNSHLCPALGHMNSAAAPSKPLISDSVKPEAKDEASPLIPVPDNTFSEALKMLTDRQQSLIRPISSIFVPGSSFTICCNNCDAAIPNVHWHCSSCDNGDFDLCVECVNKGVLCDSRDHWLIKRFVQNGKVTNSITEKIAPRKAPTINNMLNKDAPVTKIPDSKPNASHDGLVESRTCNSCVSGRIRKALFTHQANFSQCFSRKTFTLAQFATTTTFAQLVLLA